MQGDRKRRGGDAPTPKQVVGLGIIFLIGLTPLPLIIVGLINLNQTISNIATIAAILFWAGLIAFFLLVLSGMSERDLVEKHGRRSGYEE